jgi:hypothetical protein
MVNAISRTSNSILFCALFLVLLAGCCHYPKSHVKGMPARPVDSSITIVAYGDTRTGPWGLGDNVKQALQGKVVDDIFRNDGPIDAVIFTGDAVMSNFALWKKDYWRCFLCQTNRFRSSRIPFYPALGNHEVLPGIVPLMDSAEPRSTMANPQEVTGESDPIQRIAKAYAAGEEPKVSPGALRDAQKEPLDPNSAQGRAQLKKWERGIYAQQIESANRFGQFERQVQSAFYAGSVDDRCARDAQIFSDDYLKLAKYRYLDPLLKNRSYYSQTIVKNGVRVKLIALDTNCLDSSQQQQFFADEVKSFDGPMIVFGHHPPVDENNPSPWPWDMVPGWPFYRAYMTNGESKKIVLWVFGHVHDYQRRDAVGNGPHPQAPVLLVAGGGGASLDSNVSSFQWQPPSWPSPFQASAYHQVRITVTSDGIAVVVRGAKGMTDEFREVDRFTIPLQMKAELLP